MATVYFVLSAFEMFLSAKEIAYLLIFCLWMADTSSFLENCHPTHLTEKEIIPAYMPKTAPIQNYCLIY